MESGMKRVLFALAVLTVAVAAQAQCGGDYDRDSRAANSTPRTYQSRPSYTRDTARISVVYGARRSGLGEASRRALESDRRYVGTGLRYARGGPIGATLSGLARPNTAHAPTRDRASPTEYDRGRIRWRR
jgi:hypothetical protein